MASKKEAQSQARRLRKKYPNKTTNVVEISRGNWGVRFSKKGTRDTFNFNKK